MFTDTMNWFQNSMSSYNLLYIKVYRNQNFTVNRYSNLKKIIGKTDFSDQFLKVIIHYKRTYYTFNVKR